METNGWWKLPDLSARAIGPHLGPWIFLPRASERGLSCNSTSVPLELIIGERRLRAEIEVPTEVLRDVGAKASLEDLFNHYTSGPEIMLKMLIGGTHEDHQSGAVDSSPAT